MNIRLFRSSSLSLLLVLIVVCFIIRLAFFFIQQTPIVTQDSISYYWRSKYIMEDIHPKSFINIYRTPTYPTLLASVYSITQESKNNPIELPFLQGTHVIIIIQSVLGVLTAGIVFLLLITIKIRTSISFFGSLFIGTNFMLIPWEHALLTESLSITWMIWFAAGILLMAKQKNHKSIVFYIAVSLFGMFLRPAFLPLVLLGGLTPVLFHRIKRTFILQSVVIECVLLGTIGMYIVGNQLFHGLGVFQAVTSINLLGRMLQYSIPVTPDSQQPLSLVIDRYQKNVSDVNPFTFLETVNTNYNDDMKFLSELDSVTRKTLMEHPFAFLQSILHDIPDSITPIPSQIIIFPNQSSLFAAWQQVSRFITILLWVVPPLNFIFHVLAKQRSNQTLLFIMFAWILSIISLISNIFFGYEDYSRLITPTLPLLMIASIMGTDSIVTIITRLFAKNT